MLSNLIKQSNSFLYTFGIWARVYVEDHAMSLLDFVDWLSLK